MALSDKDRAKEWLNAWKHVDPKHLAYHMTPCLEHDGERVLSEALKLMGIKSPIDFVRRAQK